MCNAQAWIAGAALAVTAYGAYSKSKADKKAASSDANDMRYEGELAADQGQAQANVIRRDGERNRSATVAAEAASGVKVGEGSALDAERQVTQDYEHDAAIAILTGERQKRVMDMRARSRKKSGNTAASASLINGAGSMLSQGAAMWGS